MQISAQSVTVDYLLDSITSLTRQVTELNGGGINSFSVEPRFELNADEKQPSDIRSATDNTQPFSATRRNGFGKSDYVLSQQHDDDTFDANDVVADLNNQQNQHNKIKHIYHTGDDKELQAQNENEVMSKAQSPSLDDIEDGSQEDDDDDLTDR